MIKAPSDDKPDPAVTIDEISDPAAANVGIELIDQDAVQLQSMPLRVQRVTVRLEAAAVVFQSSNLRVRTHTSIREGFLAYVTFGPEASGTVNGLPIRPGLMLAAEPATKVMFVANPGWESVTFLVSPQDISAHLTARQREGEFRLPHGVEVLQANPEMVRALHDWGRRLTDTAVHAPELFDEHKPEMGAVQVELLEMLLATIGGADDVAANRSDRTRQAQSRIVRTAEKYALSHIADHVYVSDLCRVAAASERTLECAFKEIMGLGPVAYLIRLRLHRVRQALLAATPGSTTVSATALDWGFWHFGEFSRAYKDCFGELPSDTLRRMPESGPADTSKPSTRKRKRPRSRE
jgi:AraC family transcriptional regulator, ethanolamine operon transcriptional activator